ncbi:MAG: hypothetical protein DRQ88_07460 [Epsilonproteobacteria bacterium]|nr:MAG: hypothetical protein DRQ89_07895 [Campylobacterota bacterium]RLA66235.1 MAG: hypothetical protein DRQ88_07460 [Campylobacterota bacterium]
MKLTFFYILALLYSPIIWGKSAVIKKIYTDRDEASAELLADYIAYPKQHLIARFDNGKNCYLQIKRVHKRLALLDLRYCIYRHFIKVEQSLSRWEEIEDNVDFVSLSSLSVDKISVKENFWFDPIEEVEKREREEKLKLSQGLALSMLWSFANQLNTSGTFEFGGNMQAEEYTTGAFGLGVEYFYSKQGTIGWSGGWSFEIQRSFKYRTINFNGNISDQSLEGETLWLNMLYANINFTTFWKIYLYAGVNLSLPIESGQKLNTNPALGGQLGLGKIISGKVIVDFNYRWVNFSGAGEYLQGISKWESAGLNGIVLAVKYLFN